MKQKLLTDIELDVHELKYLMGSFSKEPTQTLAELLKRNIQQLEGRLEQLVEEIDSVPVENLAAFLVEDCPVGKLEEEVAVVEEDIVTTELFMEQLETEEETPEMKEFEPGEEKVELVEKDDELAEEEGEFKVSVLGESLKVAAGLRPLISLNDSFRFNREIFGGDAELMNRVMEQISVMSSYKTALVFLASKVELNDENEAVVDLLELLKKFFNQSA